LDWLVIGSLNLSLSHIVTTLTLGLWPRQGLAKVQGKGEDQKSHFHAPRSVGECEGMNPHIPKWTPTSNCQFDSQPLKVGNCPNLFTFKWRATYHWRALDGGTTFFKISPQSEVFTIRYGPPKLRESQFWQFWNSQLGFWQLNFSMFHLLTIFWHILKQHINPQIFLYFLTQISTCVWDLKCWNCPT
jgi:hypothetical protein